MQRSKLNRGQRPQRSTESLLALRALREWPLVCRDCGQPCKKNDALRSHRQSLKCPHCGGLLERHRQGQDGKGS